LAFSVGVLAKNGSYSSIRKYLKKRFKNHFIALRNKMKLKLLLIKPPVSSEGFFFFELDVGVQGPQRVGEASEEEIFFDEIVQKLIGHFQFK
jgi:hypothetical protein